MKPPCIQSGAFFHYTILLGGGRKKPSEISQLVSPRKKKEKKNKNLKIMENIRTHHNPHWKPIRPSDHSSRFPSPNPPLSSAQNILDYLVRICFRFCSCKVIIPACTRCHELFQGEIIRSRRKSDRGQVAMSVGLYATCFYRDDVNAQGG